MAVARQYIVFDAEELLGRQVTDVLAVDEVEAALVAALGSGLSFTVDSLPWAKFVCARNYGSALRSAKRRRPRLARRGRGVRGA